tara:strand:- start:1078 stop:1296 length:219 start_codon:yes stop_codon:yes gene_type:complete
MTTKTTLEDVLNDMRIESLRRTTRLHYLIELVALEAGVEQERFKELMKYATEIHDMDLMELRLKKTMGQNND